MFQIACATLSRCRYFVKGASSNILEDTVFGVHESHLVQQFSWKSKFSGRSSYLFVFQLNTKLSCYRTSVLLLVTHQFQNFKVREVQFVCWMSRLSLNHKMGLLQKNTTHIVSLSNVSRAFQSNAIQNTCLKLPAQH